MSDLIDRDIAIATIKTECRYSSIDKDEVLDLLNDLPTARFERKTGKWITVDKGLIVTSYKCSECGRTVRDDTGYDVCKDYPYCHCGAKMEG